MGLFSLIKNHFPDIEIHMSTQASVRNIEGVKYFAKQNMRSCCTCKRNEHS